MFTQSFCILCNFSFPLFNPGPISSYQTTISDRVLMMKKIESKFTEEYLNFLFAIHFV